MTQRKESVKNDLVPEHVDTLRKFSPDFSTKTIAALISNIQFMQLVFDITLPIYFESDANKWIVEETLTYYSEFNTLPTMEVFKNQVAKLDPQSTIKTAIIQQLKEVYKHTAANDLNYIQKEYLTFCKNQALKSAILSAATMLQRGKYEEIQGLIARATQAGIEKSVGHEWQQEFDLRIFESNRDVIPTQWRSINELLNGGLGKGEMGVVIAPSGAGKSWCLISIGAAAIQAGKRVVYYTLELSEYYVGLRFDTVFSGVPSKEIKDNREEVRAIIDAMPGELIVKYFPSGGATVQHLQAHLNKLAQQGRTPDLILVDYGDLLRSNTRYGSKHEELGGIYEELRGLAGTEGVPLWTCSQSQRSSMSDDVIGADKVAGSFAKVFVADFIISLSRKLEDRVNNTARMHVIKNRNGKDGDVFPMLLDYEHGKVSVFDDSSLEGQDANKKMQDGNAVISRIFKQGKKQDQGSW